MLLANSDYKTKRTWIYPTLPIFAIFQTRSSYPRHTPLTVDMADGVAAHVWLPLVSYATTAAARNRQ